MLLIAQLSDPHITRPGQRACGDVNTIAALERTVEAINACPRPVDLVLGTGDLTHSGAAAEYETLLEVLGPLNAPFLPVVGNHDDRRRLREAFPTIDRPSAQNGFVQYVHDLDGLRVIVIDTVTEKSDEPSFCDARAAWLRDAVDGALGPCLLAMHHPPESIGIDWLDPHEPKWVEPLAKVLAGSATIKIVCGHTHRGVNWIWRGIPVTIAPSTAHQVAPDLRPAAPPRLNDEPGGFLLHRWTGRDLLTYQCVTDRLWATLTPEAASPQPVA